MGKRFSLYYTGEVLDKDNDVYLDPHEAVDLLNFLDDEFIMLKGKFWEVIEDNAELISENDKLRNEINMLRITVARNEAYIKRLTNTSKWR